MDINPFRPAHKVALESFTKLPDDARVRLPVVCALFGYSSATAWRRCRAGALPSPKKDGSVTYWTAGALRASMAGRK